MTGRKQKRANGSAAQVTDDAGRRRRLSAWLGTLGTAIGVVGGIAGAWAWFQQWSAASISVELLPKHGPQQRAADGRPVFGTAVILRNRFAWWGPAKLPRQIEIEICPLAQRRLSAPVNFPFVDIQSVDKNNETDPVYRGSRGPYLQLKGSLKSEETIALQIALIQDDADVALRAYPGTQYVRVVDPASPEQCAQQWKR